jgi:hypothetical protein
MRDRDFSVSVIATATGTVSYTLRGDLEGIYVDVAAGSTQTVTLATSQQTLFTNASVTTDAWYPLRYALYGSTGSALTFATYGGTAASQTITTNTVLTYSATNMAAGATSPTTNSVLTYGTSPSTTATSNPLYGKAPLGGSVTLTVIGAAGTTATNATTVTVLYRQ